MRIRLNSSKAVKYDYERLATVLRIGQGATIEAHETGAGTGAGRAGRARHVERRAPPVNFRDRQLAAAGGLRRFLNYARLN